MELCHSILVNIRLIEVGSAVTKPLVLCTMLWYHGADGAVLPPQGWEGQTPSMFGAPGTRRCFVKSIEEMNLAVSRANGQDLLAYITDPDLQEIVLARVGVPNVNQDVILVHRDESRSIANAQAYAKSLCGDASRLELLTVESFRYATSCMTVLHDYAWF